MLEQLIPRRRPPRFDPARMSRALVIKLSSIGDVVQALPVATALKRRYPDLRLTWMVEDWVVPIVIGHFAIDRVIAVPAMKWPPRTRVWFSTFARAIAELRREPYDVSIDLQGLLKSSFFVLLSGAPARIGYAFQREGAQSVSYGVPDLPDELHNVEHYLSSARFLGAATTPVDFGLRARPEARATIARMLEESGVGRPRPLVVINPTASASWKDWPAERWVQVADAMAERGAVVLCGAAQHAQRHQRIASSTQRPPVDLTGRTTLPELVALLERCALHIAPDTGSAHIAAALGRPVVGIYGPTRPSRLAPWGQQRLVVFRGELCVVGCPYRCPSNRKCLEAISAADVIERAQQALAGAIA